MSGLSCGGGLFICHDWINYVFPLALMRNEEREIMPVHTGNTLDYLEFSEPLAKIAAVLYIQ
jgi:hypothetical protein